MYAVVDVETTGLRAAWHDRVVEVAVVHLDRQGVVTGQWCSLVNPKRDLGPQSIHGISASEARRAPTFAQLSGKIAGLLRGRVIVAHNLSFDARFLAAEFDRAGLTLPISAAEGLCTMQLAGHFLPAAGRSLYECRRGLGFAEHRAHSALHDAQAAAELLTYYLKVAGSPPPWEERVSVARSRPWPSVPSSDTEPVRRRAPGQRQEHFLRRLVDCLPRAREPKADSYLELLDRALLDRHISESEADALIAAAEELGLWQDDVLRLHEDYLRAVAVAALEDATLTPAELDDLKQVAFLLGLGEADVDNALAAAADGSLAEKQRELWRLRLGDVVVFTGTMTPSRERWEEQALLAGLQVGERVTKRTRLLVAADPDSMSRKADLARRYGVPIVHPSAYLGMLDALAPAP